MRSCARSVISGPSRPHQQTIAMEPPHVRRADTQGELLALLRDWEAGGCASALGRLFVLFASGHPWGASAAEEVLVQQLPAAGCLITATFALHRATADPFPDLEAFRAAAGKAEPTLVRGKTTNTAPTSCL